MTDTTDTPRRRFLKSSAGLVSGLALNGCQPTGAPTPATGSSGLDRTVLDPLGRIVLPQKSLGDSGVARVLDGFVQWLQGFEPVAEMNHPYLWTDDILYGPSDPAPQWKAQLAALDIESGKRHDRRYAELAADQQREILDHQLPKTLEAELPYAGEAAHVAVGLLAYFYNTSEAKDLGYEAAIEEQTCRGLDTGTDEPARRTTEG